MKRLVLILLFMPLFFADCQAENFTGKTAEIIGIDEAFEVLPEDVAEISGRLGEDGLYDSGGALKRLWDSVLRRLENELRQNLESFSELVLISLICAISCSLCRDRKIAECMNIAGICAVASMLMGGMDGMVGETVDALNDVNSYSKLAMPAVFTAAAAGGAVVSASARYAAVSVGLQIIMNTARDIIIPLIYCFLALSLCRGIFDEPLIRAVQRFVKWLMGISMTALTLAFSTYISLTGAISGTADALAVKAARTVISNVLPVVGGMISDAASTVLSAADMIKTSAGAMSLVAVCAICAGPFVMLSVKMLLFRLAAAACDMVPGIRLSAFINDVGTALSFLMGLLGSISIMLFVSIMSVIKAVAA